MTNLNFSYELDHIGIAVQSLDEASKSYVAMGWSVGPTEEVKSEKVRVRMFEMKNNCRIEIIEPTTDDSTIAKFLNTKGPGIHHICLRVSDIESVLSRLKAEGLKLIHEVPFRGAHNCQVAFIHPKSVGGVLIELSQPPAEMGTSA